MNGRETIERWWNRSLYHEPRGGLFSWIVLVLAVLYSVVAPLYYPFISVFIPFVLLFAIAEVLPSRKRRIATGFRIVGLIYMLLTPILLYWFSLF